VHLRFISSFCQIHFKSPQLCSECMYIVGNLNQLRILLVSIQSTLDLFLQIPAFCLVHIIKVPAKNLRNINIYYSKVRKPSEQPFSLVEICGMLDKNSHEVSDAQCLSGKFLHTKSQKSYRNNNHLRRRNRTKQQQVPFLGLIFPTIQEKVC
jgi:hypothetical protein